MLEDEARLINKTFPNYLDFLRKYNLIGNEKISKFASEKPDFVITWNTHPYIIGPKAYSALYCPSKNAIFINIGYMRGQSLYLYEHGISEKNPQTLSRDVSHFYTLLLKGYCVEELSHSLIECLFNHNAFLTSKLQEFVRNKNVPFREFSELEFIAAKDEALARELVKLYLLSEGYNNKEVRIFDDMERLEVERLQGPISEEELGSIDINHRLVDSLRYGARVYGSKLRYNKLSVLRKVLSKDLREVVTKNEEEVFNEIVAENKEVEELVERLKKHF